MDKPGKDTNPLFPIGVKQNSLYAVMAKSNNKTRKQNLKLVICGYLVWLDRHKVPKFIFAIVDTWLEYNL